MLLLYEPARSSNEARTAASSGSQSYVRTSQETPVAMLSVVYGLALLGMIVFYTVPTQLPFYLGDLTAAGPTASGLAIALASLFGAIVSLNYRRVSACLGYGAIAVATFALFAFGYGVIGIADGLIPVLVGLVIGGAGIGLLMPNINTWVSSCTPEAIRGRALGGVTTTIFLGQFLSPVASQPVGGALGFGTVYLLAGVLALLVAFFVALLLVSVERRKKLEQPVGSQDDEAGVSEAAGHSRGIFCSGCLIRPQ